MLFLFFRLQAAEAQLALKQHTEQIERRQNWRLITNPEKFLGYLKGKPKRRIELLYNPNDTEAYMFAVQIRDWLGPGYKSLCRSCRPSANHTTC